MGSAVIRSVVRVSARVGDGHIVQTSTQYDHQTQGSHEDERRKRDGQSRAKPLPVLKMPAKVIYITVEHLDILSFCPL